MAVREGGGDRGIVLGAEVVGIIEIVIVVGVVFIVVFGVRGRRIESGVRRCGVLSFFGVVPSPAGIVGGRAFLGWERTPSPSSEDGGDGG